MSIKRKVIWLFVAVVATLSLSCEGNRSTSSREEQELEPEEIIPLDTLAQEDEKLDLDEEDNFKLDGVFNDFLFAYLHSRTLRRERTAKPLRMEHSERPTELIEQFDPEFEFSFLSGEYFTTLYGNARQMQEEDEEEQGEDSIVSLQRINLNDGTIRNFEFLREQGRWQLDAIREATFQDDDLCDFLNFYARFCTDSLFQAQSIADPLHIVILDAEDEEGSIDGIIDADQWQTFCPEVPSGIISNIRKGQSYGQHKIVMRKSGLANGLQEVFTFTKDRDNWRLTRYEN
ncbi:MAG: DUF4348 domain-containing protein [Bacteroidaceae bacterium]|nr:DUF4348 domain-containing protein [Bacteroidaceae bacterium]